MQKNLRRTTLHRYRKLIDSFNLRSVMVLAAAFLSGIAAQAQGTWVPLTHWAPDYNAGVMLVLTDGTVMVKTSSGGNDQIGSVWNKLTPDIHGSYINGTWTQVAPMADTRLYYSSQVLRDGHVYVAGGEYGTGRAEAEVYYPETDTWVPVPQLDPLDTFSDANSEILPDGSVLQAIVSHGFSTTKRICIYDPVSNSYTLGPTALGSNNESAWLKLPDSSILYVDINSTKSERYIPSLNMWVRDANLPVSLYDPYGWEMGAAFMLPDGRGFFIGSTNHTAYYTPSGDTSDGTWTAGPDIPNNLGAPDAASAMMVNGLVLCAFSPTPTPSNVFWNPTYYYVFDYTTNAFFPITAPDGNDSLDAPCYYSNMVCLPDGSVLYGSQGDNQYYEFVPDGALAAGKPVLDSIIALNCDTFMAIGKKFNGITEGACYGDDWQMETNYPIVRLSRNDTVYYAKTSYWNSTGVQRDTLLDTTLFVLPQGMPVGTWGVRVVANGNPSDTLQITLCGTPVDTTVIVDTTDTTGNPVIVTNIGGPANNIALYPNPAKKLTTVSFNSHTAGDYSLKLVDVSGRTVIEVDERAVRGLNNYTLHLDGIAKGVYTLVVRRGAEVYDTRLMIE